jgi:Zn-dependent protease with chaperone function
MTGIKGSEPVNPFTGSDPAKPAAVPGPIDRVHFADEQSRYRRKSWRFSALAAIAAITTGIPACVVFTPVVYSFALLLAYIVNAISPLHPSTWTSLQKLALAIPGAADAIDKGNAREDILRIALGISVLIVPGALAMFATWLAVRGLLGRVGVGWAMDRIGARALNRRDPEEQQLGNLVEEMAIAAGVSPPNVLLIDTPEANAAVTGLDFGNSTVVVTRGLLDRLDRDETQSVIAHLVGSVGNGDLKIASIIFSIYQTWGALALMLNAGLERRARNAIWRAIKVAMRPQRREVDVWEAQFVSDALVRGAVVEDADPSDIGERVMSGGKPGQRQPNIFEKAWVMAMLPFMLGGWVVRFAIFISSVGFIGPIVSFMWRARRHLADAMAVQLTRYPNGLASALQKLNVPNTASVKGADGLEFLFIVWPGSTTSKDSVMGQFSRMHPKLHKRQRRIRALGATNVTDAMTKGQRWTKGMFLFFFVFFGLLIGPLMAVAFGLSLVVLVMMTMLSLMMMEVFMVVVWFGLKLVFITIPHWIANR